MSLRTRIVSWLVKNSSQEIVRALADMYPALANQILILSSQNPQEISSLYDDTGYASYVQGAWLRRAIDVWCQTLAPLPLRVVNARTKNDVKVDVVDRVLKMPNENMTATEFWHLWALDMGTRGEFGCEVTYTRGGRIAELYHHPPDEFFVRIDKKRQIYRGILGYQIDASYTSGEHIEYFLKRDQFIHWRFYNPQNCYRGLSRVSSLRLTIRGMLFSELWNDDFFRNSARPDLAVIVPQGLAPKERAQRYKELQERFGFDEGQGRGGRGKFIISEKGVEDVKPISFAPKDIEFLKFLGYGREAVGAVMGVPKEYMFYGTDKYENLDKAEQLLWTGTIIPLSIVRDDWLTHFFRMTGYLNSNEQVRTDFRDVKALIRVDDPAYRQAGLAFGMGVPFKLVNEHFKFGYPRFATDENSYPFGTQTSFTGEGEAIDEGAVDPGGDGDSDAKNFGGFYERLSRRNGHAVFGERGR